MSLPDSRRTALHATPRRAGRGPCSTTARRASRSPGHTCGPLARSATLPENMRELPPNAQGATSRCTRRPRTRTTPAPASRRTAPSATPLPNGLEPSSITPQRSFSSPADIPAPNAGVATRQASMRASAPHACRATWPLTSGPRLQTMPPRASRSNARCAIPPRVGSLPPSTITSPDSCSRESIRGLDARTATSAENTQARRWTATPATKQRIPPPPTLITWRRDSQPPARRATPPAPGRGQRSFIHGSRYRIKKPNYATTATRIPRITRSSPALAAIAKPARILSTRAKGTTCGTARIVISAIRRGGINRR